MSDAPDTDLGTTARWTAAVRAQESEREDRLLDDPWAAALAGDTGRAWIVDRPPATLATMVLRTRFYDDWLQRVTRTYVIRQVVLLAAGLDTRAFRLDWPNGTVVYELDRPDVLQRKEEILQGAGARPRTERRVCQTDLALPRWTHDLVGAGFAPTEPAVFLGEGFFFYLPSDAVLALIDRVGELGTPGSALGFDIVNGVMLTHPYTQAWVAMQAAAGAPWRGVLDDPLSTLAERGWQARLSQCGDPEAHHGRWTLPVLPITAPDLPHHWLVTATRTSR